MNITIEMDERQRRLLYANAERAGVTPEDYVVTAVLERMEDEQGYRIAEAAYFEWLEDPRAIAMTRSWPNLDCDEQAADLVRKGKKAAQEDGQTVLAVEIEHRSKVYERHKDKRRR